MRYLGSKSNPLDVATKSDSTVLTVERYGMTPNRANVSLDTDIRRNSMAVYGQMIQVKLDFTWTKDGTWGQVATLSSDAPLISVVTEVQMDGGANLYIPPNSRSITAGGGMVKGKRYIVTLTNFL